MNIIWNSWSDEISIVLPSSACQRTPYGARLSK